MTTSYQNDDFSERLRLWRVGQKLTQAEAAPQLDIERSYLSQLERGRAPGNALRTRFHLMEKAGAGKAGRYGTIGGNLRNLPVLSWAQAGEMTDCHLIPENCDEVVPSDAEDERAFAVRLRGDSMEPRFSDGDIAVLLPGLTATNGETVLVNLKDEGVQCKIMHVQLDKSVIKLSSYNPAYPPVERHRDQFHWICAVGTILRQLRRI